MSNTAQDKEFEENNKLAQMSSIKTPTESVDPMDINSLPDDVRKNIKGLDNIELEHLLLTIMESHHHVTVDKIILTLWLSYNKKYDRMHVIQRLRHLQENSYADKVPNRRGIYFITDTGRKILHQNKTTQETPS